MKKQGNSNNKIHNTGFQSLERPDLKQDSDSINSNKFKLIFENSPESLSKVRELAFEILRKAECSKISASDIILCIDEALANAIRYGQSMDKKNNLITFSWWIDKNAIYFQIADRGIGFEPDLVNWRPPADDQEKGRGIYIMKQLLTGIKYEDTGIGTTVTLCKSLND